VGAWALTGTLIWEGGDLRIWSPTYQSTTEVRSNEVGVVLAFPVLSALGPLATKAAAVVTTAVEGIVLQKSKVAGLNIFRENTKQRAIADSYGLNRVTEVACEICVSP
jgi:hypothetical protein